VDDDKYLLDKLKQYTNLQVFHDTYNHLIFL